MATNESNQPGILMPVSGPVYDDRLDDVFYKTIVGLTPLDPSMVMPRWQEDPPELPAIGTDWCSVGITDFDTTGYATEVHVPGNEPSPDDTTATGGPYTQGSTQMTDTEEFGVLLSFYGPNAMWHCANVRKGIQVGQNRDLLQAQGISVVVVSKPVVLPALIHNKWVRRVDARLLCRRLAVHEFAILDLRGIDVTVTSIEAKKVLTTETKTTNP